MNCICSVVKYIFLWMIKNEVVCSGLMSTLGLQSLRMIENLAINAIKMIAL